MSQRDSEELFECSQCGADVSAGDRTCPRCGHVLGEPEDERPATTAARGFAGLSALVSDVAPDIAEAQGLAQSHQDAPAPAPVSIPSGPVVRSRWGGMSAGKKTALVVGAVLAGLVLIGVLSNQSSPPPTEVTSPPAETSPPDTSGPSTAPASEPAAQPPSSPATDDQTEVKPPVGTDLVLDAGQIRYCLAEDIRMKAISALMESQRQTDVGTFNRNVNRFNARVDDFNSRCGQYKYYPSTFNRVREEVESQRAAIEERARADWQAGP
jgi:hypothetical protein